MTLGSIPVVDSYFLLKEPILVSGHLEKTMEREKSDSWFFSMGLYKTFYEYKGLGDGTVAELSVARNSKNLI